MSILTLERLVELRGRFNPLMKSDEETATLLDRAETALLIEDLRAEEGDWLTLHASNASPWPPNDVVEFGDLMTPENAGTRVEGDNLLDCLRKAREIKALQRAALRAGRST